ncbi:MAG TPA: hypothetical protein VKQ31_07440 [Steroidobacteraceae bacterium]|nr:hypothetical protein [Steroidobacteraceae bacterium]
MNQFRSARRNLDYIVGEVGCEEQFVLQAAEHIVLESDAREVPQLRSLRREHASLQCRSRLRRRSLHLSIIDYYYLAVRMGEGKAARREYVLDLRFIDPSFALMRHIPWRCICAALALTAAAASTLWFAAAAAAHQRHLVALISAALCAGAVLAYLAVAARLVETVALHSLHGRAVLLEYRGSAGTLRRARPFMRKLAAHVQLAAAARRSTRTAHLRDELREHYRLKEAGVLGGETYEACKARILARH